MCLMGGIGGFKRIYSNRCRLSGVVAILSTVRFAAVAAAVLVPCKSAN